MCLMLYIATDAEIPEQSVGRVTVQAVDATTDAQFSQSFSKPFRRFVGVDHGCSCEFPSVVSESPITYFDGMFGGESGESREPSVSCIRNLVELLSRALQPSGAVELYPAWAGDEASAPKGRIDVLLPTIVPAEFFFNEGFLYTIRAS